MIQSASVVYSELYSRPIFKRILGGDIEPIMPKFLADHTHLFNPFETNLQHLGHAILRIAVPQPMHPSRPAKYFFACFAKNESRIDPTGEVVELVIFNARVDDDSRFIDPVSFKSFSQMSRQLDFPD